MVKTVVIQGGRRAGRTADQVRRVVEDRAKTAKDPLDLVEGLERQAAMHPTFMFSLQLLEACDMIRTLAGLPPRLPAISSTKLPTRKK